MYPVLHKVYGEICIHRWRGTNSFKIFNDTVPHNPAAEDISDFTAVKCTYY
jgi:hypothetical protein